jgi:hypothetical protein
VPTGYSVDESHEMWNIGSASMAENKGIQYVLYFNEVCISFYTQTVFTQRSSCRSLRWTRMPPAQMMLCAVGPPGCRRVTSSISTEDDLYFAITVERANSLFFLPSFLSLHRYTETAGEKKHSLTVIPSSYGSCGSFLPQWIK